MKDYDGGPGTRKGTELEKVPGVFSSSILMPDAIWQLTARAPIRALQQKAIVGPKADERALSLRMLLGSLCRSGGFECGSRLV